MTLELRLVLTGVLFFVLWAALYTYEVMSDWWVESEGEWLTQVRNTFGFLAAICIPVAILIGIWRQ